MGGGWCRHCSPSRLTLFELSAVLQALIRKYMPIGVIVLIFFFVVWARWFFYGRR